METQGLIIQKSGDEVQILCEKEFTRSCTDAIQQMLATEKSGTVILSLQRATTFDVAAIQFVFALKKKLEVSGHNVRVLLPESESIKDLLVKTGITKLF
jgi:hypothetical protein